MVSCGEWCDVKSEVCCGECGVFNWSEVCCGECGVFWSEVCCGEWCVVVERQEKKSKRLGLIALYTKAHNTHTYTHPHHTYIYTPTPTHPPTHPPTPTHTHIPTHTHTHTHFTGPPPCNHPAVTSLCPCPHPQCPAAAAPHSYQQWRHDAVPGRGKLTSDHT